MANVPMSTGQEKPVQAKPAQPAVFATNPVVSAPNTDPVQNVPLVQNTPPVNNSSVAPKQVSGSPWDDDLDEDLSPAKKNPTIIGSLDPKTSLSKANVVPLKLPENMEEKVGQKIPAASFIGPDNDQSAATPPSAIVPESSNQSLSKPIPKASTGFMGRLFKKNTEPKKIKETVPPKVATPPVVKPINNTPIPVQAPGPNPEIATKVNKENNNSIIKKALIVVPGLVVVFVLASFLTEMGLLSIGLENVYGALGIEQLWGGLSPKTETALGRSALTMQGHPDFKADGKISITIDKAIKSDIVTPLLALTTGQSLARDESINSSEPATLTASDDYYFTTNSNSNSNSNLNSNSNSNLNSNSTPPTNSNLNTNGNVNGNSNSGTQSNSSSESSTSGTKSVEGVFSLKTSSESNETTISLNDSEKSIVSLVNDKNQLFVKTSGAVTYGSSADKWLALNVDKLKDKSLVTNIFNLNVDSGFSVKGARVGNEKVDNVRCYKYRIDSLEIGSSLSSIGITSDMVPTLSGDVWIGIKDKLIHKMSIKITTPVSSAVRMVNLDIKFSDFDVKNSIQKVSSSDQVTAEASNLSGDDKRKAGAKILIDALAKYKTDNKSYPISTSFIKLNSSDNVVSKALVPRYLTSMPEDPKSSSGWYYAYKSADGTKCVISARLENQSDKEGSLINNVLLYFKDSSD